MRLLIGLILGIVVFLFGLTAFAGGMDQMGRRGFSEEVGVAIGIGVVLMGVAVAIFVLSVKAHNRRKAIARGGRQAAGHRAVDRGETEGLLMGIGMATLMNNDDGGDDGGDFGD